MYDILSIEDVSRPRCKRYVANIRVDTNDKDEIRSAILRATKEVRSIKAPAHVVRLYVYFSETIACQSMWVDTSVDAPLPKPLDYNDKIDDIGIVW